ncbi:hypothetical protein E2C01_031476 [Portunus trituberculatus]|uniref:Uncharacterized protein n=1 Tax=Portunus trituberculatus TaxID=210409 RepID=A0A5B7ESW4_PORTR|nr:hypothetical protein [Portunus trituberculatus]
MACKNLIEVKAWGKGKRVQVDWVASVAVLQGGFQRCIGPPLPVTGREETIPAVHLATKLPQRTIRTHVWSRMKRSRLNAREASLPTRAAPFDFPASHPRNPGRDAAYGAPLRLDAAVTRHHELARRRGDTSMTGSACGRRWRNRRGRRSRAPRHPPGRQLTTITEGTHRATSHPAGQEEGKYVRNVFLIYDMRLGFSFDHARILKRPDIF